MGRRDTNFYYSFLVLPEPKRRAIIAVWDFCRAVDDDVDERAGQLATAESRRAAAESLAGWRAELAACYEGRQPRTPQGIALAPHVAAFRLPRKPLEDVIDGVEIDLDRPRFRTFDELRGYCLRVASAVGLVCIEIFEYTNEQCRQYAIDLGIALQLTNILRDLGRDFAAGRLYLPTEDLARFGVTEEDLRAGRCDGPGPRAARLRVAARARSLFAGRAGTAARGREAPRGRADHGRDLPQSPPADRDERLRRVRRAYPGAALAPGLDCRIHVARHDDWALA